MSHVNLRLDCLMPAIGVDCEKKEHRDFDGACAEHQRRDPNIQMADLQEGDLGYQLGIKVFPQPHAAARQRICQKVSDDSSISDNSPQHGRDHKDHDGNNQSSRGIAAFGGNKHRQACGCQQGEKSG